MNSSIFSWMYLDPVTGKLAAGWKQIEGKWYYFNAISVSPTYVYDDKAGAWLYNALSGRKPYGALYQNEQTPDGYAVDARIAGTILVLTWEMEHGT